MRSPRTERRASEKNVWALQLLGVFVNSLGGISGELVRFGVCSL